MAVASSALLKAAGRAISPARKKARMTEGPVFAAAKPGKTKRPETIAPTLMLNTERKPRLRSKPLLM